MNNSVGSAEKISDWFYELHWLQCDFTRHNFRTECRKSR